MLKPLLLSMLAVLIACRGGSTSGPAMKSAKPPVQQDNLSAWKVNDAGRARIQARMQENFFAEIMKNEDYHEGYALFSYGGWSNEGQVMIFSKPDDSGDIVYIAPNTKQEQTSHSFTQKHLASLRANLNNVGTLQDFTPKVFDGIEYEYVHAVKRSDSSLDVKTRIYMKVPNLAQGTPNPYQQIVEGFATFRQQFYHE